MNIVWDILNQCCITLSTSMFDFCIKKQTVKEDFYISNSIITSNSNLFNEMEGWALIRTLVSYHFIVRAIAPKELMINTPKWQNRLNSDFYGLLFPIRWINLAQILSISSLYKSNRMSLSLFVCFFANSSKTVNPNELKFRGMIPLWLEYRWFRLKHPTVGWKPKKAYNTIANLKWMLTYYSFYLSIKAHLSVSEWVCLDVS